MKNTKLSLIILVLLTVCIFAFRLMDHKWKPKDNSVATQLSYDSFGYYLYLPSAFIYHDFSNLTYLQKIIPKYKPTGDFSQAIEGPKGKYVNKYPMGEALLYLPFFIVAHFLAIPYMHYLPDGFSAPYQFSIGVGCVFYFLIGMYYLRKTLLQYFSDGVTAITFLCVALGTNLFYYATTENTLTHNQLFFVFAVLIYLTDKFYRNPTNERAMLIGIGVGLATLIRPTEAIAALIPCLWGVTDRASFMARVQSFIKAPKQYLIMAVAALLVFAPQIVYWKMQSGHFFFYSYGNESLNFKTPHLADVLFSFRKGWLLYTPMMILALIGVGVSVKKQSAWAIPLVIFVLLNTYIISCWDCWWYGGCFGQRAFVQSYALLAFPLALFINSGSKLRLTALRIGGAVVLLALVALNLFQTKQYQRGIIHYESMSKAAYMAVFCKMTPPSDFSSLLVEPDYSHYRPQNNIRVDETELLSESFENGSAESSPNHASAGSRSYHSNPTAEYSPSYSYKLKDLPVQPEIKIDCTFQLFTEKDIQQTSLILSVEKADGTSYIYKSLDLQGMHLEPNKWHTIEMWVAIPRFASADDVFKAYVWNRGDTDVYIDDMHLKVQKKVFL